MISGSTLTRSAGNRHTHDDDATLGREARIWDASRARYPGLRFTAQLGWMNANSALDYDDVDAQRDEQNKSRLTRTEI